MKTPEGTPPPCRAPRGSPGAPRRSPSLKDRVGACDILLVTFDTLRYDVAQELHLAGRTPHLSAWLGNPGWEERHSPASFTFPSHQSLFAGFGPTPVTSGPHRRTLALAFPGSNTIGPETLVLEAPDLVQGLQGLGYHGICVGGVGFFNPSTPLGKVLSGPFHEAHWSPELGVGDPRSPVHQVDLAIERLDAAPSSRPVLLFLNISALHQPNYFYLEGAEEDSRESHGRALEVVDREIARLFDTLVERGECYGFLLSDHGTCYGEDGWEGHRHAHPLVWTVPYQEGWL